MLYSGSMKGFNPFKSKKRIYLDYASMTPVDSLVLAVMKRYSCNEYANPSSWYKEGVEAKKILEGARKSVAESIGALPDEIIFTGGGTEANNIAIFGVVEAARKNSIEYKDMHMITSVIEHSSVLECFNRLESFGVQVDFVSVDKNGVVLLDELKKKIRSNTILVSIMMVNNEIGSVQPLREIAKIIRRANNENIIFHTDASQAYLYNEMNVAKLGVDLLTLDGSKVYGPRGVGALYIKRDTNIVSTIFGGGQEKGLRSGTENIASIAGLAKALEIAKNERGDDTGPSGEIKRIGDLRMQFIQGLKSIRSDITVNGDHSSPHIVNVSIPNIDNEFFVLQLDAKGVACSTKSSCLRDEDESYVLRAIGANSGESVRFSFGRYTKSSDVKKVLGIIRRILI